MLKAILISLVVLPFLVLYFLLIIAFAAKIGRKILGIGGKP